MHDSPSRSTPSRKGRGPASTVRAAGCRGRPRLSDRRRRAAAITPLSSPRWRTIGAPGSRTPSPSRAEAARGDVEWRPLLTDNVSPRILAGYGDPAVLKTDQGYVLVATSNDAPDAFPILRSDDLEHWQHEGFVFPEGQAPGMDRDGPPGRRFLGAGNGPGRRRILARSTPPARRRTPSPSASPRAHSPFGPWRDLGRPLHRRRTPSTRPALPDDPAKPLLSGGVIDSHIFIDARRPALPVLEGGHQRSLAAPARRPAARAAGADRAAVRRARRIAAPPPSPPPSCPGPTAAGRWSASS